MQSFCCPSFEGFIQDGVITFEEEDYPNKHNEYRINTVPRVVNASKQVSDYTFLCKSLGINYCAWCGTKL